MNELFALLIILAAIISFLNKIFGQKKKQPTTRQQPAPKPTAPEWIPPWLEPEEVKIPVPEIKKEEFDIVEETEDKRAWEQGTERKEDASTVKSFLKKEIEPIISQKKTYEYEIALERLEALNIDLSTREQLRRGIILAEILGPCRARKNLKK